MGMELEFEKKENKFSIKKRSPPENICFRGGFVAGIDEISNFELLRDLKEVIESLDLI